ncbi:hypothetical protein [Frigoriglobus tundricola]|uniref:Uncharacterized protein n=1 Tax=Frigoriglobus tundricola TaxID=2774151 RepID=A0A6M5Z3F3_9BACT|nr:hypothetical protein [Frigoriglobus tundricola]QJX00287.1 hypothetical protein FTUN_7912 [Frigoriglobus tundricola]
MRYVIGVLFFGGFVVFVTPAEMAVVVSTSDGSGDPLGLLGFGLTCAIIFGAPGYFAFPYRRRFQAVGWLALACMGYGTILFGMLALLKRTPAILTSPDSRSFVEKLTIHYGILAAITLAEFATWACFSGENVSEMRPVRRDGGGRVGKPEGQEGVPFSHLAPTPRDAELVRCGLTRADPLGRGTIRAGREEFVPAAPHLQTTDTDDAAPRPRAIPLANHGPVAPPSGTGTEETIDPWKRPHIARPDREPGWGRSSTLPWTQWSRR